MSTTSAKRLNREGRFVLEVASEPEISTYDSGAEAVSVRFAVVSEWNAGRRTWQQLEEPEEIRGDFFITAKSGEPIQGILEMLKDGLALDPNDPQVRGEDLIGRHCQADVRQDCYGGTTRFRITKIHHESTDYNPPKTRRLGQ